MLPPTASTSFDLAQRSPHRSLYVGFPRDRALILTTSYPLLEPPKGHRVLSSERSVTEKWVESHWWILGRLLHVVWAMPRQDVPRQDD